MNGDAVQSMMVALPVATAGVMLAMAGGMLRATRPQVRWIGVVFTLAVAAYAIKFWNDEVHVLPDFAVFLRLLLGAGAVGWFWLPAYVVQIVIALLALNIVVRGWKGDLVEARRRLRGPFLFAVASYIVALRSVDILEMLGTAPGWVPAANAVVRFAVCLAGALVFLESRDELFGPAPAQAPVGAGARPVHGNGNGNSNGDPARFDRAAKADLGRLQALMATHQIWREEGLTIASLALKANMPEAHLRRLINDRLGYRNFPSFVNAHRIAAAKARLADPDEARTPVSAIAFDLGFASLGPFNRAFRDETGQSPSEWRRKALSGPDEPEND
jgi:AraC-like DNA-binding protein